MESRHKKLAAEVEKTTAASAAASVKTAQTAAQQFEAQFGYLPTIQKRATETFTAVGTEAERAVAREINAVDALGNARKAALAAALRDETSAYQASVAAFEAAEEKKVVVSRFSAAEQAKAAESLQRQRSAALAGIAREAERVALFDKGQIGKGTSYTDQIVAESKKSIKQAEQAAVSAEHAITNTSARLAEANTTLAATGRSLSGVAGTLTVIGGIGAVGAIAAGGLFEIAKSAAESGDELYRLSQRTGLSVETLSALKLPAKEVKSSLDALAPK